MQFTLEAGRNLFIFWLSFQSLDVPEAGKLLCFLLQAAMIALGLAEQLCHASIP